MPWWDLLADVLAFVVIIGEPREFASTLLGCLLGQRWQKMNRPHMRKIRFSFSPPLQLLGHLVVTRKNASDGQLRQCKARLNTFNAVFAWLFVLPSHRRRGAATKLIQWGRLPFLSFFPCLLASRSLFLLRLKFLKHQFNINIHPQCLAPLLS